MTCLIGTLILALVLIGGVYLYVQTGRLEEAIRRQEAAAGRGNGRSNGHGRRARRAAEEDDL